MKKKLLLTGYIGNNNLGDDLMMQEVIARLLERYPDIMITVMVRFIGVPYHDMTRFGKNVKVINLHTFRIGKIKELIYKYCVMSRFDATIWVGGTCFSDVEGHGLYAYFKHDILAKHDFGYLGIGIDYLSKEENKKRAAQLFENSAVLTFRDSTSYATACDLINDYGCKDDKNIKHIGCAEDIVYLTLDRLKSQWHGSDINAIIETKKHNKRLLISARNLQRFLDKDRRDYINRQILNSVIRIAEYYDTIAFLPLDEFLDHDINVCLKEQLESVLTDKTKIIEVITHMEPADKVRYIATSDTYICGRLHGVMIAELCGVKTVALNYAYKMDLFMESIGRQSDAISVEDVTEDNIINVLSSRTEFDSKDIIAEKIKQATNNFEHLYSYIENQ